MDGSDYWKQITRTIRVEAPGLPRDWCASSRLIYGPIEDTKRQRFFALPCPLVRSHSSRPLSSQGDYRVWSWGPPEDTPRTPDFSSRLIYCDDLLEALYNSPTWTPCHAPFVTYWPYFKLPIRPGNIFHKILCVRPAKHNNHYNNKILILSCHKDCFDIFFYFKRWLSAKTIYKEICYTRILLY